MYFNERVEYKGTFVHTDIEKRKRRNFDACAYTYAWAFDGVESEHQSLEYLFYPRIA